MPGAVDNHDRLLLIGLDGAQPERHENQGGKDEGQQNGDEQEGFLAYARHEFALYDDEYLVHDGVFSTVLIKMSCMEGMSSLKERISTMPATACTSSELLMLSCLWSL